MSRLTRRDLLKSAATLGVAAAVAPALGGPARAQTTQQRELVIAQGGDITSFDPHMSPPATEIGVACNISATPGSRHPDGKLCPGLAAEWKLQGQTTWVFKLRTGVKFHNGDPFSAADVKYSIERTWDPALKTRVNTVLS